LFGQYASSSKIETIALDRALEKNMRRRCLQVAESVRLDATPNKAD